MSKRISLKLTDKNDQLVEAIEKEQEEKNRPSFNNMVETILVSYFKGKEKRIKMLPQMLIRSSSVAMEHNDYISVSEFKLLNNNILQNISRRTR